MAGHLREGDLTLGDVLQLSHREMRAIARVADGLRRRGRLAEALTIYGMLATVDPLNRCWWSAMATLHLSGGEHALAVVCYETLALLEGRNAENMGGEARALELLGAPELVHQLTQLTPDAGSKEQRP